MRNIFYLLAALLSFGVGVYYFQQVSAQTATITKLRLVAEDGELLDEMAAKIASPPGGYLTTEDLLGYQVFEFSDIHRGIGRHGAGVVA